ncbi:hypothetical protein ACO0QE_001865 [Hanseniaspora vineae]
METTVAGQPVLRELEKDVFVCKKVGLSLGRHKILNKQCGRLYLTTQRLIYIDDRNFKKESCFIDFNDVLKFEFSSGFWKSSPKVIVYFKEETTIDDTEQERLNGPGKDADELKSVSWNCPICMINNESAVVKENKSFVCVNCGVPCSYQEVMNEASVVSKLQAVEDSEDVKPELNNTDINECPRCTFINHKDVKTCEICGSKLPNSSLTNSNSQRNKKSHKKSTIPSFQQMFDSRVDVQVNTEHKDNVDRMILISLRDKHQSPEDFFQLVVNALVEHNLFWNQDKFNQNCISKDKSQLGSLIKNDDQKAFSELSSVNIERDSKKFGLSSLEEMHETKLVQSDIIMGSALKDLGQLISMSEDIVKLYQTTSEYNCSANNNKVYKPASLVVDRGRFQDKSLFLSEMSREIFEFVMNLSERNEHSLMINLIDLYAMYNKTIRVGCGFISPTEFKESCEYFEKLGLSNNLHIMQINNNDIQYLTTKESLQKFQKSLLALIKDQPGLDLYFLNKYLQEMDNSKTWSIGIITELLRIQIKEGQVLIDQDISGQRFYLNECWTY